VIFSTRGGVDIEQVAAGDPAALSRLPLNAASEGCEDACRRVVEAADLGAPGLDDQLVDTVRRLWALYRDCDASLVEVNPLAVVDEPVRLVALDAKVTIDDNALYRQPGLAAQRPDEDDRERAAREAGVTYLSLDGNVGVLGNGAGLVMSTLDMIGAAGGKAADFRDIGGDDEERAAAYAAAHLTKPVIAYIAGFTAPPGMRMGHPGAIISGSSGTAAAKAQALEAAGVPVARRPDAVPALVAEALAQRETT